jgi:hypothetical protein
MELCPDCKMPNPWFDPATGPEAASNFFRFQGLLDDAKTERNLMLFAAISGMMCIVFLLTSDWTTERYRRGDRARVTISDMRRIH